MAKRLSAAKLRDAAPLFAALGDPTRLALGVLLSAGGPESIARLSEKVDVSRQAVTKHLNVLADAGLARSFREGRESIWELEPDRLECFLHLRNGFVRQIVRPTKSLRNLRQFVP